MSSNRLGELDSALLTGLVAAACLWRPGGLTIAQVVPVGAMSLAAWGAARWIMARPVTDPGAAATVALGSTVAHLLLAAAGMILVRSLKLGSESLGYLGLWLVMYLVSLALLVRRAAWVIERSNPKP